MADWLKVNHTLLRSAKVRSLMRELRCKKHTALGLALNWLIWVDEQTSDGNTNLLPQEVDEELGFKGASKALCAIGWANVDENGLVFAVDFGKHCGETAKARAVNAQRVAECKQRKKDQKGNENSLPEHYFGNEKTLPEALPEPLPEHYQSNAEPLTEKKRIEYNIKDVSKVPLNTTVVISADAPARSRSARPIPADYEEVRKFMAGQAICGLKGDDLFRCAAGFFDDMEARGWTTHNGAPLFDWQASARKYLRSWQTNSLNRGSASKAAQPTVYRSETTPDYSL